jgi:serine/threonine protein kinase
MSENRRCARCGADLPARSAPETGCSRCLLALGLSAGLPVSGREPAPAPSDDPSTEPPERIGPFRVVDVLGTAADSVVYLAEGEAQVRRPVAVRVVGGAVDTAQALARLEADREALASLGHPGIAKLLDVGTAEGGRPYVVTEWVPGVPVTEYCDRERLGVRERLGLFVEVCEAVEEAHGRGLVHGELKPSNILVTGEKGRPRPRVTDFGIAGALDRRLTADTFFTPRGLLVAQPAYTSPEQCGPAGHVADRRSDVYAMGVLLYELLVGAPPFDTGRLVRAGWAETARVVREEQPPRPSARVGARGGAAASEAALRRRTEPPRLARELRGDLDWIVLKALEKDPSRRYPSAAALASDLRRRLAGEPVVPGLRSLARRLLGRLRP